MFSVNAGCNQDPDVLYRWPSKEVYNMSNYWHLSDSAVSVFNHDAS